ncbi:MAG: glycosyltransferase family 4 protein [Bacteroidetes bacterium]|nr:glycosyltransferase family 4 protein [Bacteroidota bacterium]
MKKVLIIAYHFPPAAGAATQRILKFLKYLPKFGWEGSVLTVENVDYPDLDHSLIDKIPEGTKVYRTKFWTPFGIYRRLTGRKPKEKIPVAFIKDDHKSLAERISVFLRLNLFLPDAKVGWIPYAVKKGVRLIRDEKIDAIISSGPPHTCHLIARNIKRKTKVKWIADFRDPWTDIDYYSGMKRTKLAEWCDSRMEKSVLKEADCVVSASGGYLKILKSKGIKNSFEVITNGFDPDDFLNIPKIETNKFVITYTGNMPITRNPEMLWQVFDELVTENSDFKQKFEFWFAGVMDEEIRSNISDRPFYQNFKDFGYVSHSKAIEIVFNSHLLIMIVNKVKTSNEILPGKIFEYIATGNQIMVIGPEEGEAGELIRQVEQGEAFNYVKKDEMKGYIIERFKDFKDGKIEKYYSEASHKFTREKITEKLSRILGSLIL